MIIFVPLQRKTIEKDENRYYCCDGQGAQAASVAI